LQVGRALKSVDARLLSDWTAWARGNFPPAHCQAVWDALEPRSCDTHSTSYSATRETFLKLLRPGVDYREAFHKVVRRRLRKAGAGSGQRFDDNDKLESEDLVLSRRELRQLLTKELGILMRGEEMRRLVDSFDTNEDRLVRWEDFEKLTGGVREAVRGDAAKRLEKRCVWETTCPETGMPNAFVVSAVKKTATGGWEGAGGKGVMHDNDEDEDKAGDGWRPAGTTTTPWGGTCEIITLKSGDRRWRNELADRAKRLRILRKYGLAHAEKKAGGGGGRGRGGGGGGGHGGGEYDDDGFEGEDDDDDSYGEGEFERSEGDGTDRSSPGRKRGSGSVPCEASQWPMYKRIKGLQTLKRLGKANREASELRQLLAEGVAPKPPKFWSAEPGHPDVGSTQDDDALTEELLLCWRPQHGSAVAFYSLEMSGPEGGKAFCQGAHREICRDPPDADGDPQYQQFWVRGLRPNTRYGFRVRAFNGFGPGPYAHGCFATRPCRPAAPVAVKLAQTEVTLQWVFGGRNAAKVRELRNVFDALDEYDDGQVSREEFLASLDLDHPHLMAFLKAITLAGAATDAEGEAEAEAGGGADAEYTGEHHRRRSGAAGGRRSTGGRSGVATVAVAVGPEALSVFDAIEANDDDFISWDESNGRGATAIGGGHFVVEVCTSQGQDRWKEAWKGTTGTARVKMLEVGMGYRFRVRPTNCEGLDGPVSESVVVNTLLPTPWAPRINVASGKPPVTNTGVWDTRVRVRWDAAASTTSTSIGGGGMIAGGKGGAAGGGGTATDRAATKILMQWAHECSDDRGVSVEAVFSQFDRDGRGVIDPLELGNLLEALGVEVTEERLREAFTELDRGGDGIDGALSLDDFEAWWHSDLAAKFVLMRDDGVAGNVLEMAEVAAAARSGGGGGGGGVPPSRATTAAVTAATALPKGTTATIASFKGRANGCEVAGLAPNTLYHFRVRAVNARTRSSLSAPLEVMTAPRRPEPPVIIRCEQRSIVAKWYPGCPGSAHKYRLQARLVEGLDGIGAMHNNKSVLATTDNNRANTTRGRGTGGNRRSAWGAAEGGGGGGGGCGGCGGGGGGGGGRAVGEWVTVYEGVDSTAKV
ncbi:unnamed protein product, partial [Ectocarpus sp. 12 AP-2014]